MCGQAITDEVSKTQQEELAQESFNQMQEVHKAASSKLVASKDDTIKRAEDESDCMVRLRREQERLDASTKVVNTKTRTVQSASDALEGSKQRSIVTAEDEARRLIGLRGAQMTVSAKASWLQAAPKDVHGLFDWVAGTDTRRGGSTCLVDGAEGADDS